MNIDEKTQGKIKEIQVLEQTLHSLLIQKQAFQLESNETQNALSEISNSKEDVFKIIGQIMIKSDKEKVKRELKKKQELLNLRLKLIDKQELELSEQLEKLREEIMKNIK